MVRKSTVNGGPNVRQIRKTGLRKVGGGSNATVLWSKVVCKQPGNYLFTGTIGLRADGEILVVFSGDREQHVCPFGKTQIVRSSDGGET